MYLRRVACITLMCISCLSIAFSQSLDAKSIIKLNQDLEESSALICLRGIFYTINDSGGKPEIYEIDRNTGTILRTVKVKGAENKDWEALTFDSKYLYVGDIGNNYGNRKDLGIYKIQIEEFLTKDQVEAKHLSFNYKFQLDFDNNPHKHIWDAETLVSVNGQLLLISKNWKDKETMFYRIDLNKEKQSIRPFDTIATAGYITDGFYDSTSKNLFLSGYDGEVYLTKIQMSKELRMEQHNISSYAVNVDNSVQVEGLTYCNDSIFLTSERYGPKKFELEGELSHVDGLPGNYLITSKIGLNHVEFKDDQLFINHSKVKMFAIKSDGSNILKSGRVQKKVKEKGVNLKDIPYGNYHLILEVKNDSIHLTFKKR